MELDGSSSLFSTTLTFGGGGGGGGRMVLPLVVGEDVEDTIAPDGIRNSLGSVLNTIAAACIVTGVCVALVQKVKVPLMSRDDTEIHTRFGTSSRQNENESETEMQFG